jgi:ABC-type transport system involved in multi-copper enzyme maturation permease subunit
MRQIGTIVGKEWSCFAGSEKGVFVVYAVLLVVWSFLPRQNALNGFGPVAAMWWMSLSVIVCSIFANSVFVSERISGSMEILLTSGISRNAIIFGKIAFVVLMSAGLGVGCTLLSLAWPLGSLPPFFVQSELMGLMLYFGGAFMGASAGAWMSIRFSSPRTMPFVNWAMVLALCSIYYGAGHFCSLPLWTLFCETVVVGCAFLWRAQREFNGEKVIAPVDV